MKIINKIFVNKTSLYRTRNCHTVYVCGILSENKIVVLTEYKKKISI